MLRPTTLFCCVVGTALFGKDAERSMRDIEATLLVCAQQCALDDEDEVCATFLHWWQGHGCGAVASAWLYGLMHSRACLLYSSVAHLQH